MNDLLILKAPVISSYKDRAWIISDSGCVYWRGIPLYLREEFITDLASVPRWVKIVIDDDEPGLRMASAFHDAAYRKLKMFAPVRLTRRDADDMLYDIALSRGLPKWKALLVWTAVRLFGWRYWVSWEEGVR